jgi:DNA-binding winged helix-turn-helix (wHTH) protein
VLIALLNKPGEVVTREELRQELWPSGTFVDFEHGLRVAVNKLRQARNDDPENPRFLETLPRRGYRFICPVTTSAAPTIEEPESLDSSPVKSSLAAFFFPFRIAPVLLTLTLV